MKGVHFKINLLFFLAIFVFILYVWMVLPLCMHVYCSALRGTGSTGTGVIGGNELPNMDAGS